MFCLFCVLPHCGPASILILKLLISLPEYANVLLPTSQGFRHHTRSICRHVGIGDESCRDLGFAPYLTSSQWGSRTISMNCFNDCVNVYLLVADGLPFCPLVRVGVRPYRQTSTASPSSLCMLPSRVARGRASRRTMMGRRLSA